jgi:hypothetical protein
MDSKSFELAMELRWLKRWELESVKHWELESVKHWELAKVLIVCVRWIYSRLISYLFSHT